ncbi:MAG: alpha/beta fold hydrolase [Betaproteobacteria bacterium]|nr:alpha/beta fold hydrolase [Betaproteobacteria bacterium]
MSQDRMDTTSGNVPLRTHWIPRFLASGVDYFDLQDLLKRIDRWEIWCREWSAKAAAHEDMGLEALAGGRYVTAAQALGRAAAYYHFAGFRFYEDMAQKDQADRKAWECYRKAAPYLQPPAERIAVPFEGTHLVGYLRLPPAVARAPCIIIIAGMDSRKEEMRGLEDEFLARGMATVTYDGPGQGETWANIKMTHDSEKAVSAIVDFLALRSEVDATRVGVYGWAMGGYFAPRAAASDSRLRACVSMPVRYGLESWDSLGKMQTDAYCYLFGGVSFEEGRKIGAAFTMNGVLPRLRCPYLIIHGDQGDTVDREVAERAAREAAGPTRLVVFEEGDHLCINIRHKSWPLMMDWFAEQLAA